MNYIKKHFSYHMELLFEPSAYNHSWSLKCLPKSDMRQEILSLSVTIEPKQAYHISRDQFGNVIIYGRMEDAHSKFSVTIDGMADTGKAMQCSEGTFSEEVIFRNQSKMTRPGETIKEFFNTIPFIEGMTNYEKASLIRQKLYEKIQYVSCSTNVGTTAEEAFAQGKGVCQDYSHIMISLCRMARIPARYVVGLMHGEGVSHAWVEIFSDGFWYGEDPTNNCLVYDWYVKLSHGRDSKDCLVNRGKFYGATSQKQNIRVIVEDVR